MAELRYTLEAGPGKGTQWRYQFYGGAIEVLSDMVTDVLVTLARIRETLKPAESDEPGDDEAPA